VRAVRGAVTDFLAKPLLADAVCRAIDDAAAVHRLGARLVMGDRAVHRASVVAARGVPRVLCYQSPSATIDFRPSTFIPAEAGLDAKLHAIAAFGSQTAIRDYLEPEALTATARYWGRFARIRYAEPFEVVRSSPEVYRSCPDQTRRTRVLVTGAGGPAAVGFLHLAERAVVDFYGADFDPVASGLYFVPTVDTELLPLAGVRLDKAELARVCASGCEVPTTTVLTGATSVPMPSIVTPRAGSGSRGVRLVDDPQDLVGVPRDGSYIVQEYLPGEELSVDVFVPPNGVVVSPAPRTRDKVDSGVAVAGRTAADAECVEVAMVRFLAEGIVEVDDCAGVGAGLAEALV